ncbi:hypothetical protein [Gemmatimonas sp.]|uniref:hypothetical protein n=1 Tax=Gemmatimonas sp. TaxID=1962908 RepID=UPI003F714A65
MKRITGTHWAKYPTAGEIMGMPGDRSPMRDAIATLASQKVIVLACANSIRASGGRFLPPDQRADRDRVTSFGEEVRANLLPGVEVVPAMIVSLQRARERACRYIYAGG